MVRLSHAVRPAVEELEPRRVPTVTFTAQTTFAAGNVPIAVAAADFNGDGRPDLAAANFNNNFVSVWLNTTAAGAGTPTLAAQRTFAVGTFPDALAVGDFNGDARPDLAVVCDQFKAPPIVSILLNTTPAGASTVSFAAAQTFAVGNSPTKVVVADFNGDGRPDLAVLHGAGTAYVFLNTTPAGASTVSFAAPQTFATGGEVALAAVDLNGDGRPDLVVTENMLNTISVLVNTTPTGAAAASFAAPQTFAVGNDPLAIGVGDFNGDGRPDLSVANAVAGTVSVLVNTTPAGAGAVSFATQQTFTSGAFADAVAVGDFDGDGRPDLALADYRGNSVSVLVNTTPVGAATPSFAAPQLFSVDTGSQDVTAADFNGDGRPDLATVNNLSGNTLSVLLNTTAAFAGTAPVVVGQFGGQGIWEFSRAAKTWVQLTAANASALAAGPSGDVAGAFPGHGVWLYRPSAGWRQINGVDATLVAMDPLGDVAAQFPGYGVGEYLPGSGWRSLTGANASLLTMDASGDVAGEFPGFGVWLFRPSSGWKQINGTDAALLAMDPQGDLAADFPGFGVGEYMPAAGWKLLNGTPARALAIDPHGDVTADFPGVGVGEYLPATGWRSLTAADASLLGMGADGLAVGEFAGFGVWEYDPYRGWHQLTAADATLLAIA
jgi:hypothetical protein